MTIFNQKFIAMMKDANTIEMIIDILKRIDDAISWCIRGASYSEDFYFNIACQKALRMGEFDKLMFEYPAKCKDFLFEKCGWKRQDIDSCYNDHYWDNIEKKYYPRYYARRMWNVG